MHTDKCKVVKLQELDEDTLLLAKDLVVACLAEVGHGSIEWERRGNNFYAPPGCPLTYPVMNRARILVFDRLNIEYAWRCADNCPENHAWMGVVSAMGTD